MSAMARFAFRPGTLTELVHDAAFASGDRQLAIERDEARLDAVTLWLHGWLDGRTVTRLVDECRTRLLRGQRVLVDLSALDGIGDDAVEALHGLSADGCFLFNSTRSLFPPAVPHTCNRHVKAR